jgi:metallo-beta-lactamase class B
VSAPKYRFRDHPDTVRQYEASFARLGAAHCDVLITPHPEQSRLFERLEANAGKAEALQDEAACRAYVQQARDNFAKRLASEG